MRIFYARGFYGNWFEVWTSSTQLKIIYKMKTNAKLKQTLSLKQLIKKPFQDHLVYGGRLIRHIIHQNFHHSSTSKTNESDQISILIQLSLVLIHHKISFDFGGIKYKRFSVFIFHPILAFDIIQTSQRLVRRLELIQSNIRRKKSYIFVNILRANIYISSSSLFFYK